MSGLLTQALQNVESAEQQIKNLNGLPPAAEAVKTSAITLANQAATSIHQLQTAVQTFVPKALANLKTAETQVSGDTPVKGGIKVYQRGGVKVYHSGLKYRLFRS